MAGAILRLSVILAFFAAAVCVSAPAIAQVSPTNTASISGSVADSAGKPVANATVSLSGPRSSSTRSDGQGLFTFVGVPFGTYTIQVATPDLGTAVRTGVSVEGDINVAIEFAPTSNLKTIASVSSQSTAGFNISASSVTQVNPLQNALAGKTSWRTILEQIPGVAQAGLGTGLSTYAGFPSGPFMPVQVSINGALPYETATLLDDMPLIGGSNNALAGTGTDLSLYSLNGFTAADVVRGPGANAPSIVDSIGGSLVLHPAGPVSRNASTLSVSTDPYGGIVANAVTAARWRNLSAVLTYGVNDSPGPTNQANIPGIIAPLNCFPVFLNGVSLKAPVTPLRNTNYVSGTVGAFYGYSNALLACCYQDSTAWSQHGGSIALNYQISPSVNAAVFYSGKSTRGQIPSANETINFSPAAGYTGSLPAGQHLLNLDGSNLLPFNVPESSSLVEEKLTARLGNGTLRLAALQNRTYSQYVNQYPASAALQLFGSACIASPPGGTGGCPVGYAPMVFNGGIYNLTLNSLNLNKTSLSNNRDLLLSYATSLGENFLAGASYVKSYYDIPFQCLFVYGPPTNATGTRARPSDASQTTNELRIFVGGSPSAKTSVDLSGYFVNATYHVANPVGYSSTTGLSSNGWLDQTYTYAAPRLGFVWRPSTSVAVRAAVGGGFAEAPLGSLVGSSGAPFCSGGICQAFLTNVNLQPEKSFGFDLGTDVRLRGNTVLSFDVYHTNLFGQLYTSTTTTGSCQTCGGLPLYVTESANLGESRYEGILLTLRHDLPRGMYWSVSGGLTRGYVVSVPAGFYNNPGATCNFTTNVGCKNQTIVPGVNFNGTFTGVSVPYSQGLGTVGYRWSAEKYAGIVATYFGNNNTYFRPAFMEFDGIVGYPLTKQSSLLLTFQNITGIYDGVRSTFTYSSIMGVPTVAGPPAAVYGQQFGPRTVVLTLQTHL